MNFIQLLEKCAEIKGFPTVKYNGKLQLRHANPDMGIITGIKRNGRFNGCSVQFEGVDYDTWFHDSNDNDGRSRYMRDLEFVD